MPKFRIRNNFTRYRDSELSIKAKYIIECLTNNTVFPTPQPPLPTLTFACDTFSDALAKTESGSKEATATKNEWRQKLITYLHALSFYIETYAHGNEVALLSSGFELAKQRQPIGMLAKPEGFTAKSVQVGNITLKLDAVIGATAYQYEHRLMDEEAWQIFVHTKTNMMLTNLTSGAKYQFRVAAVGTSPVRTYSDMITSYIL